MLGVLFADDYLITKTPTLLQNRSLGKLRNTTPALSILKYKFYMLRDKNCTD